MIWRLHLKNDVDQSKGYSREFLAKYCMDNGIIGVGWPTIRTRTWDDDVLYKEAKRAYPHNENNLKAGIKAVRAMRDMRIGDLIWTRIEGVYYLCRVTGLWENTRPTSLHDDLDLTNYCHVRWLKIGTAEAIPGKVVSSMRPAATVQRVNGVDTITKLIWNFYAGTEDYRIEPDLSNHYWDLLDAESIEEIVLLYLQVEKRFFIYTSTVKRDTQTYECVLVNSEGVHAYPQVKSGNTALDARNYEKLAKREPGCRIYLFATSQRYFPSENKQIICIQRSDIEAFIEKNRAILPATILYWIDLCKSIEGTTAYAE
ncbi:MAG: hypothetical protein IJL08_09520 [Oscillospiraceae bacterium]|nr:hypothetical protein [Oscillospiraceae bacterium]